MKITERFVRRIGRADERVLGVRSFLAGVDQEVRDGAVSVAHRQSVTPQPLRQPGEERSRRLVGQSVFRFRPRYRT